MSYHMLRAGLDAQGKPLTWRHYVSSEGIGGGSSEVGTGASSLPYKISAKVSSSSQSLGIPVGYWRSVFNTNTAFVNESFMDELAAAAGKDPYEYRLSQVSSSRMETVLKLAAEKGGWGSKLPDGWGRGIACYATWSVSFVAQVAEVSVEKDGSIRVRRVVCAVDCGVALNLDTVEAQMEGGIIAGMSALFKHEVTIKNGRVEQHNFRNYPLVRMDEAPVIEVYVVPSTEFPSGIGEMSNPVTPPAIANAIFAATGKRIRRLPIRTKDLV
jgi:isoquinoline 1-oxidoreductase beta subunit